MAKLSILAGATSQSVNVFIQNSSVTTGAGLTGLVFNTASLVAYYNFTGANATATAITLATLAAVNSAYSSGGFKEIDATNMPGLYRLDIPNAALATSKGQSVVIMLKGAANMVPCVLEIELTAWNNQDGVRAGLTALPNAAAEAAGGLYTRGSGAGQINQQTNGQVDTNLARILNTAVSTPATAGILDVNIKNINNVVAATPGATGGLFIAGTNAATTVTTSFTTTFTGNLTGSVGSVTGATGSVTGAVGSVTGNVGGNVTGSVGSVVGLTASNLDATISSRMATYTQPTGFLAATFPATVASTTNITAGTITTVTNLTNAPTAGDFTAVMKTSLNNATPSVTISDKTGFSLTSAYDPAKTASQAGDAMTLTAAYDAAKTAASATTAAAIKAKTDSLTFTVAGQVDSNIQYVNDTLVTGSGTAGSPWGP